MVAALTLLASLALAGGTGQIGEGAGRLTPAALKQARRKWGERLCLSAIELDANVFHRCSLGKQEQSGWLNYFRFRIYNADRPDDLCYVEISEAVSNEPVCVISPPPWPPLDEWQLKAGIPLESFDQGCLSGMKVESGAAIAAAVRAGLAAGATYKGLLAEAAGPDSGFWKYKALRGRTFWEIRADNAPDTYVVDAMTGKVLLRRKGFIRFPRRVAPDADSSRR